jgi:mycothiol synthase
MAETEGAPQGVPLPAGPRGVSWRQILPEDLEAVHALLARITDVDEPGRPAARSDLEQQLGAVDPAAHTALAMRGDRAVAYGIVFPTGFAAVRLPGGVSPDARGEGIGHRLLAWQVAQARAVRRSPDIPISARQPSAAAATAALLAHAGFRPERIFLTLRRSSAPVVRSPLPSDLRSVPLTPEHDEPLRIAKNRAFADHWRSRPETPDGWAQHQLGPWLRRSLSRIAITEDGAIVGFVVTWAEAESPGEAYIALVGTDPGWRGRGVARALLTEVLAACTADGRPVATLEVDGASPTSADRLYASIGFERTSEAVVHGLRT